MFHTRQKVTKVVTQTGTETQTDYLAGGFQYINDVLQFFPHAEGYVSVVDNHYNYVFNYTDHLGNIRVSYGVDPSTQTLKILEENHYYPFGLKHEGYNMDYKMYQKIQSGAIVIRVAAPLQPNYTYKYNGKELQNELGLDLYDYGARNYDPAIGRWMNIDPLAENSRRWTPYNYAYNNPMYFVDPDGMQAKKPDDIIILSYGKNPPNRHDTGHQAVLIGDDKNGWTFYSKDKDAQFTNEDGTWNDNYTIENFNTLEDFANSEYNTFKSDYDDGQDKKTSETDSEGNVLQRFKDGFLIKTSKKQDKDMSEAARKETEKEYSTILSNCTHVVKEALDAGGLNNGESSTNYFPKAKQAKIEKTNKGTDVDAKLIPKSN